MRHALVAFPTRQPPHPVGMLASLPPIASHGRSRHGCAPLLRSACWRRSTANSELFAFPSSVIKSLLASRHAERRPGVPRERQERASLHRPSAPHRRALVADALKRVPTQVHHSFAYKSFIHPLRSITDQMTKGYACEKALLRHACPM